MKYTNFYDTLNEIFIDSYNKNHVVCGDMMSGNAKKAGGNIISQNVFSCAEKAERYPFYNIAQVDENNWIIELALAGYDKTNISVEEKDGYLIISGKQPETSSKNYVHRGIALRSFKKSFKLAEWMVVRGASMSNGMLNVNIELVVPEEKKPKKFEID